MYKNIEFVCSGNNGRSPVAQAAAYTFLRNNGHDYDIRTNSSGTLIKGISKMGYKDLTKALEQPSEEAKALGLISAHTKLEELDRKGLYSILNMFLNYEEGLRNTYMAENKLVLPGPHVRKQTIVRPEAGLILPIDNSNLIRVQKIYDSVKQKPEIELLGDFAGEDINVEEAHWIKSYDEFESLARRVQLAAEKATQKVITYYALS